MAMMTHLQMVSADELSELEANPDQINALNQSAEQSLTIQFQQTAAFFLCGSGWPSAEEHGPLAGALMGFDSVDAPSLENAAFGVVRPEHMAEVIEAFDEIDLDEVAEAIEAADLEELFDEEELYDIEDLLYQDADLAGLVCDELNELIAFYIRASDGDLGVVLYTT